MNAIPLSITRKELTFYVRLSVEQIRRSEKRIGLDKTRVNFSRRPVLYRTAEALQIFQTRGFALSAHAISFLTQEYVSTHKNPTRH